MHGGPQTESRSIMDPKHTDGSAKNGRFNLKTHVGVCSGQKVMQNAAAKTPGTELLRLFELQ